MIGAGKDESFQSVPAGSVIEVKSPTNIGTQDVFDRRFGRDPAKMQNRINPPNHLINGFFVRKIAAVDVVALIQRRCNGGETQYGGRGLQTLAKHFAQVAGRTC